MERDAFLERVRAAMTRGRVPSARDGDPGPLVPDLPPTDLVALFSESLTRVDGHVHMGDPLQVLGEIVELHGHGPFISWDVDQLPERQAIGYLERSGCTRIDGTVSRDPDSRHIQQIGYMDIHIGLTGAEAAFAETGSIVLRSGAGRPRMASLVPLIHIALVSIDRLFRSPMHWLTDPTADITKAANVVYITGPSRTADIEQHLNLGVHGPRELHVILM
ncbi:MAG: lactate utilization protein [Acidimicrobiia bacterium]|nr:MAG: lactate utilization protein [Acidimicrobiia bacterium]